ncbi:hypothetical protein [Methylobacterium iners]|uniref:Uncharacterized protein n=1 Tax=Methylobacterium iners TaxID=418707 RepID=A0ABQ4RVE7_9HYPH|nr:hypothetical protein [Methylobacterium iners]GJD94806.1 hypothetical protein OCOJLMKI_2012 [Methylobacterium iners]
MIRYAGLSALAFLLAAPAQAADSCDALTAKMIRATGASLAGRTGALAVFRAADAERMSLECAPQRQMIFGARQREPIRPYFVLIGLAAEALTGASAEAVEVLALNLHQDSLLTGTPRTGHVGRAALRCETGPRLDALAGNLTVCRLTPNRTAALRRRAGLPAAAKAG